MNRRETSLALLPGQHPHSSALPHIPYRTFPTMPSLLWQTKPPETRHQSKSFRPSTAFSGVWVTVNRKLVCIAVMGPVWSLELPTKVQNPPGRDCCLWLGLLLPLGNLYLDLNHAHPDHLGASIDSLFGLITEHLDRNRGHSSMDKVLA